MLHRSNPILREVGHRDNSLHRVAVQSTGRGGSGSDEARRRQAEIIKLLLETEREEAFRLDPRAETTELVLA